MATQHSKKSPKSYTCCRSPSWLLPVCCHYDCHHACDSDCYPPAAVLLATLEAARVIVSARTTCPVRVLVAAYAAPRAAFAWNHSCLCDHPVSCFRCRSHSRSRAPPRCLYRLLAPRTARLSRCRSPASAVLPCCAVPACAPAYTDRCPAAAGMTAPARPRLPQLPARMPTLARRPFPLSLLPPGTRLSPCHLTLPRGF